MREQFLGAFGLLCGSLLLDSWDCAVGVAAGASDGRSKGTAGVTTTGSRGERVTQVGGRSAETNHRRWDECTAASEAGSAENRWMAPPSLSVRARRHVRPPVSARCMLAVAAVSVLSEASAAASEQACVSADAAVWRFSTRCGASRGGREGAHADNGGRPARRQERGGGGRGEGRAERAA